jgi:Flp pilus assembly pilin Flp
MRRPDRGTSVVEFTMLVAAMAGVVVGLVSLAGPAIGDAFSDVVTVIGGS